jgi:hypothetical protein
VAHGAQLWHALRRPRAEAESAATNTTAANTQRDIKIRRIDITSCNEKRKPTNTTAGANPAPDNH